MQNKKRREREVYPRISVIAISIVFGIFFVKMVSSLVEFFLFEEIHLPFKELGL